MARLVVQEGGRFPLDFDQRPVGPDGGRVPADELGETVLTQGLLVAAGRRRKVKIPPGTPEEPRLTQKRQSRITVMLATADPKFSYRPAESDPPDIGVRFDRANAAASLAGRGLDSQPTLATAMSRKTTTSLSDLQPQEPTHRLFDLSNIHETVAVALFQSPSDFKLRTLTTGGGGMAFPSSVEHYQILLAQRLIAKIEPIARIGLSTETGALAAKTEPSKDLLPEIPWS